MSPDVEIEQLLKANGAQLKRQRKHKVYGLSNGAIFVRSSTPCKSGDLNDLHNLKRLVGANKQEFTEGERRQKRVKTTNGYTPEKLIKTGFNSVFAEKLATVGLLEDSLRDEIAMLNYEVEILKEELRDQCIEIDEAWARYTRLENKVCQSWWCRLKAKVRQVLLPLAR